MRSRFVKTEYHVYSSKISHNTTMVFISDLHNHCFGVNNDSLLAAIEQMQPDAILIGGDMIVGKEGHSVEAAKNLIPRLSVVAPIFHALGNHEYRLKYRDEGAVKEYLEYEEVLKKSNVVYLDNENAVFKVNDTRFSVTGLSLPKKCFSKLHTARVTARSIKAFAGESSLDAYQILLAHNPRFAPAYFDWGADLILSGHYHGGMVRLGNKGVISPHFTLFPAYGYGRFDRTEQTMLVSAGMGEHTIPLRMFNPRELVVVHFHASEEKGKE